MSPSNSTSDRLMASSQTMRKALLPQEARISPPQVSQRIPSAYLDGMAESSDPYKPEGGVHRTLKQRHMAMIAIGGAIGTGKSYAEYSSLISRSLCRFRCCLGQWWTGRCLAGILSNGFHRVSRVDVFAFHRGRS